jgi:hypothetical protein
MGPLEVIGLVVLVSAAAKTMPHDTKGRPDRPFANLARRTVVIRAITGLGDPDRKDGR